MNYDDETLGQMARGLAAGWPGEAFLEQLRHRRHARSRIIGWCMIGAATGAVLAFPLSTMLAARYSTNPLGTVSRECHVCDAGNDVGAAFRAAVQAEQLGDRACAVRNFNRVVQLTAPEHANCSVADHAVDAQVAISRWELAKLGEIR